MAKSAKKSKIVIKIEDMHKWYGQFHALKAINLEVTQGERIVICGPSGSGKSTFLNLISGFASISSGSIIWNGQEISNLPIKITIVFSS